MVINNLRPVDSITVQDLENGHLFKSVTTGCIGLKMDGKFFYLTGNLDNQFSIMSPVWNSNKDGYNVYCIDLGRLVSVDEVTVE